MLQDRCTHPKVGTGPRGFIAWRSEKPPSCQGKEAHAREELHQQCAHRPHTGVVWRSAPKAGRPDRGTPDGNSLAHIRARETHQEITAGDPNYPADGAAGPKGKGGNPRTVAEKDREDVATGRKTPLRQARIKCTQHQEERPLHLGAETPKRRRKALRSALRQRT